MGNVKTAVSLEESLFEQVEALAREMKTTRSSVFALALEDFVRRHQNRQLLERLNAAYAGEPDPTEEARRRRMLELHRQTLDEW